MSRRPRALLDLGKTLGAFLGGTALISADAGYLDDSDTVRFALRLDPRAVTGTLLADLKRTAMAAGSSGIEHGAPPPGAPGPADDVLTGCSPAVRDLPTPEHLGVMLAEALGIAQGERVGRQLKPPRLRYRRGDEWLSGRLCRIGEDGVLIAAAAPPRVGDRLDVELSTPGGPLVVPAVASHVASDRAAAALGSAGFSARFAFPDAGQLRAASPAIHGLRRRLAGAQLPPRRRELRHPLRWPAFAEGGAAREIVWLRDVSRRGLFVEGAGARVGARIDIGVVLDTGARISLLGRATRAAREGCGVELVELTPEVDRTYQDFVARVATRSRCRVAIGASARRLDELSGALQAAGYAVRGADTTRALCERAFEGRERPDLVVVDASLDGGGARRARALGRALAVHRVPSVHIETESPAAARRLVDAALLSS